THDSSNHICRSTRPPTAPASRGFQTPGSQGQSERRSAASRGERDRSPKGPTCKRAVGPGLASVLLSGILRPFRTVLRKNLVARAPLVRTFQNWLKEKCDPWG